VPVNSADGKEGGGHVDDVGDHGGEQRGVDAQADDLEELGGVELHTKRHNLNDNPHMHVHAGACMCMQVHAWAATKVAGWAMVHACV
jgi:hypothetical protein